MTERDVIVRCPGCGNGMVIPAAVGQLLQCDICHTSFAAPVTNDGETDPPTMTDTFSVEQTPPPDHSAKEQRPKTPGSSIADAGSHVSDSHVSDSHVSDSHVSGGADSIRRTRSWQTNELGIAESASNPTAADASASRSDSDEELDIRAPTSALWTVIAMLSVAVILTTVGVAVFFVVQNLPGPSDNESQTDSRIEAKPIESRWTDASRYSQRVDSVMLKVERVVYGTLRAKDLTNQVITTEDDNLLGITVSVQNRGPLPRKFQNWYGHAFVTEDGEEIIAELADDRGASYALLKFDDVSYVEGQRLADQIEPKESVQDTVVFLIPDDTDRSQIKYFRLALPGAAAGMSDFFRFEIPTEMIVGFDVAPAAEQP